MVGHNLLRHSICESISCARHSSADCFAEYQEVRLEVFKARVAAGPSADRVGLIDDHESAVFARYFPQFLMVARFGVNDPHIGHHWFSQYTSDIPRGERLLQRICIVEFDHPCSGRRINRRANVTPASFRNSVVL